MGPQLASVQVESSTCIMVPRETYGRWPQALEHLALTVPPGTRLIAVDAGEPGPDVRAALEAVATRHDVLLLRTTESLSPNAARALAMPYVDTDNVVFIDNDAFGDPGWLERLEQCASATGAWAVGPLYCIGHPDEGRVHMAGGSNRLVRSSGAVDLEEAHHHSNAELVMTLASIERGPTELIEFHCALVRAEALQTIPLDTRYRSIFEHNALCLRIREAGREVMLEPSAQVTYWPIDNVSDEDRAYFRLRWSRSWNRASAEHFAREFGIPSHRVLRQDQFRFGTLHRYQVSKVGHLMNRLPKRIRTRANAALVAIDRHLPCPAPNPVNVRTPVVVVNAPDWTGSRGVRV